MSGHFLESALRQALHDPALSVTGVRPAAGGCIHTAARLSTTLGDVFAKWNHDCAADVFLREADGLRELRGAGSALLVPEVLSASAPNDGAPAFILMEYLAPRPGGLDEAAMGRGLATIHRRPAEAFGFAVATYCGPTRQDNTSCATWVEFYAERRLLPLVQVLERAGLIGGAELRLFAKLRDRLAALLPHEARPSLIHGDLWSGNVMATPRGPALFDPACAYADREMEFGITTLFGGFSSRFFAAYEEAWPLPAGWRDRNPLYQLYHLLNHAVIFGGGYLSQALAVARRYV